MSLRWSPDGKRIYVGTSPVGVIIAASSIKKAPQILYRRWQGHVGLFQLKLGGRSHPAGFGAWSHDGKWIVVAAWQRRASIWNTAKGRFKQLISDKRLGNNPLDYMFSDLAASADGKRFALGALSGKIHIFNTRSSGRNGLSLKFEKSLSSIDSTKPTPYSLAFHPRNPNRLIATYMPSPRMAIWKIDKNVHDVYGDEESGIVWRVAFDPEGEFIASATNDAVVRIWRSPDPDSALQLRGHLAPVMCVDISPDRGIVASGSSDGTIRFWAKQSPLSAISLSNSASMPAPNSFGVEGCQIWVTATNGKKYSVTLPERV